MSTSRLEKSGKRIEKQLAVAMQKNSIRRRSQKTIFGLPLYDIAFGPDLEAGELRGHAKGVVAIGDVATGGLAIGGLASGGIAIGGLACGLFSLGGCAFGLLGVMGGVALGGFAMGGVAIGLKAMGGVEIDPGWID